MSKLRIAVDVIGTIEGNRKAQVLTIIHTLLDLGHEVEIWSSDFSCARNAVTKYDLQCLYRQKHTKIESPSEEFFDYAIEDDRRQTYLAAKNFLWVDELPTSLKECEQLAKELK